MALPDGVYDQLLTRRIRREIAGRATIVEALDDADAPRILGKHVGDEVARRLASLLPVERLAMVQTLLQTLGAPDDEGIDTQEELLAVAIQAGVWAVRPQTPLSVSALFTNSPREPRLDLEIGSELASTDDEVLLLCAFLKVTGLRLIERQLREAVRRGTRVRVLTTTYVGATEREAVDRLVALGAEVRVSYETAATRLHAKAWLFRRRSGLNTGYVGSSNLSRAALTDGVEWNVRLSVNDNPTLLDTFRSTFEGYWADPAFESYDGSPEAQTRLDEGLLRSSGRTTPDSLVYLPGLDLQPRGYQRELLDRLSAERELHGRFRNLLVAATGTGKTVMAAFDFKEWRGRLPNDRLLFVAHRKEILQQAVVTYRQVLGVPDFGRLWVDGVKPPQGYPHVFASIQSLKFDPPADDDYDIVVIDEVHHAAAASYRPLLEQVKPRILLGLTATPERTDGQSLQDFFESSVEIRLWEALELGILAPFQYFGVNDDTDLRSIRWERGGYDLAALSGLFTGNDARARTCLQALKDQLGLQGLARMKALVFCVSVAHSNWMANWFNEQGLSARSVTGETPSADRAAALAGLRSGEISLLCSVDVFNEGVDVPDVDTIVMLRPTESPVLFLQQLGRGLRRSRTKACLTVIDLVGQPHDKFRFDGRLTALTGVARGDLADAVKSGFPYLPPGCSLVLDEVAQERVLANLNQTKPWNSRDLLRDVASAEDTSLHDWLVATGRVPTDLYRSTTWTELRRRAHLSVAAGGGTHEADLLKRLKALTHVDDAHRLDTWSHLLTDLAPIDEGDRTAAMLAYALWPATKAFSTLDEAWSRLRSEPAIVSELLQLFADLRERADHLTSTWGREADIPLRVHAAYTREELLAAVGYAAPTRAPASMREGVAYVPATNVDVLLVTLTKTESHFSPSTRYRDYAISPRRFHWETQSVTTPESVTGRRYLEGTSTPLLFVRQHRNENGRTAPYVFLGPGRYVSHEGRRPISITWELAHAMPARVFAVAAAVAA